MVMNSTSSATYAAVCASGNKASNNKKNVKGKLALPKDAVRFQKNVTSEDGMSDDAFGEPLASNKLPSNRLVVSSDLSSEKSCLN